jgi:hypothetical protein
MYGINQEVLADRRRAIESGGAAAIAALFRRMPSVALLAEAQGPLRRLSPAVTDKEALARFLTSRIEMCLVHAGRLESQLLGLCAWHGGMVRFEQAVEETGLSADRLQRLASGLADLFLVDPAPGHIGLRAGVMEQVELPGILFRPVAEGIVSRDLASMAAALGVESGERKWQLVEAIESALRDPALIASVLDRLHPGALDVFETLASTRVPKSAEWRRG